MRAGATEVVVVEEDMVDAEEAGVAAMEVGLINLNI